jgi:hypothetical protein
MHTNTIKPYLKNNPVFILNEKDFDVFLLKFGSLLFLLNNKNINPTFLFISLVKDENLQKIFIKMSGINNLIEILKTILVCYPNLIKSKIVKDNSIKILKNKKQKLLRNMKDKDARNNRKSKKNL